MIVFAPTGNIVRCVTRSATNVSAKKKKSLLLNYQQMMIIKGHPKKTYFVARRARQENIAREKKINFSASCMNQEITFEHTKRHREGNKSRENAREKKIATRIRSISIRLPPKQLRWGDRRSVASWSRAANRNVGCWDRAHEAKALVMRYFSLPSFSRIFFDRTILFTLKLSSKFFFISIITFK